MAKDNTKKDSSKQVLILVRHGKRGYIVEAAGSKDPYPCLEAQDVGEAVLEILNDPDQQTVEYAAPEPGEAETSSEEPKRAPGPDEGSRTNEGRPENWTAGDEMIIGLAGNLLQRARKFSDW